MSTLTYPHTTLNNDLPTLSRRLRDLGQNELAELADKCLAQYRAKKQFYTSRIAELESNEDSFDDDDSDVRSMEGYVHTQINQDMVELIGSLQQSSSPQKQFRLERAQRVLDQYNQKKAWFFETIRSLS